MKSLLKNLKNFYFKDHGITLVELIIAITVMVMMLGISSIYLPTYRANQVKKQAALDLNDSLRFAQSLAASPEGSDTKYYHWHYDADTNQITIMDDQDANQRVFKFDGEEKVKVVIDPALTDIYVKTKTPVMYQDEGLTQEAAGKIQIYHIAQTDANNLFYQISVSNNTFNLTREVVGQTDDATDNSGYIRTTGQ